jgi:hypothetical protein
MPSDDSSSGWFDQEPEVEDVLRWAEPDDATLDFAGVEGSLLLSWWPVQGSYWRVDASSRDSAVLQLEDARSHGVVIETRCFLKTANREICIPVELESTVKLRLTHDPEGTVAIPAGPTIVAVWPRPGRAPTMSITRGHTGDAKLGIEYGPAKAGLSQAKTIEEKFDRYEPTGSLFVGDPGATRLLCTGIRATDSEPSIEGDHFHGIWIGHDCQCFLQMWAELRVAARFKSFGIWRKRRCQAVFKQAPRPFELQPVLGLQKA